MKTIIEENSSETITVVTDKNRLSISHLFKGPLPDEVRAVKVMILNKRQVRHLLPIAQRWLLDNA